MEERVHTMNNISIIFPYITNYMYYISKFFFLCYYQGEILFDMPNVFLH